MYSPMKGIVIRGLCENRKFSRIFSLNYTSQSHQAGERAGKEEEDGERRRREQEQEQGKGSVHVHEMTEKGSDEEEVKEKAGKEKGGKPVDEDKGVDIIEDKPSAQSSS